MVVAWEWISSFQILPYKQIWSLCGNVTFSARHADTEEAEHLHFQFLSVLLVLTKRAIVARVDISPGILFAATSLNTCILVIRLLRINIAILVNQRYSHAADVHYGGHYKFLPSGIYLQRATSPSISRDNAALAGGPAA